MNLVYLHQSQHEAIIIAQDVFPVCATRPHIDPTSFTADMSICNPIKYNLGRVNHLYKHPLVLAVD